MQNKPNFQKNQMNANPYNTRDYENKWPRRVRKNKPNSNPIKPNLQKAQMNANVFVTKDYERNEIFTVRKNKPNSNPISVKPKMNVTSLITRDYRKTTLSQSKKTNPKQTQFQTTLIGFSKAHRYLAKGRVSGTTFTCVVNL